MSSLNEWIMEKSGRDFEEMLLGDEEINFQDTASCQSNFGLGILVCVLCLVSTEYQMLSCEGLSCLYCSRRLGLKYSVHH